MARVAVLTAIIASGLTLTACAQPAAIDVTESATVIDVRTSEEYASGHLEGAVNIDVSAVDFEQRISQLDPAGEYIVYCRSGNRSAQAVAAMESAGFTAVRDARGLSAAAEATGLDVVS